MKHSLVFVALVLICSYIVHAQSGCGNSFFETTTAAGVLTDPVFSAGSSANGNVDIGSNAVPSSVASPVISNSPTNCYTSPVFTTVGWENEITGGTWDERITLSGDALAVLLRDVAISDVLRMRYYDQDGNALSHYIITNAVGVVDFLHVGVTSLGAGGVVVALADTDGDLHFIGFDTSGDQWSASFDEDITLVDIDYNAATDQVALLGQVGNDLVVYLVDGSSGALNARQEFDGNGAGSEDIGYKILIDSAGKVYVLFTADGTLNVMSFTAPATLNWNFELSPAETVSGANSKSMAFCGNHLCIATNFALVGGRAFKVNSATGALLWQADFPDPFSANVVVSGAPLDADLIYIGGSDLTSSFGAVYGIDHTTQTSLFSSNYGDSETILDIGIGDFLRLGLVGLSSFGFDNIYSQFVVYNTGAVDFGIEADIAGSGTNEFGRSIIRRTTAGYSDVFIVGGNNDDGETLLFQLQFTAGTLCVGAFPNGILEPPEECDDGNNDNGDACGSDCVINKQVSFVLFDLSLGHNLLFSKLMDLLHILKDLVVQLEVKSVEVQLAQYPCNQQPVSFWIPSNLDPYGKLNEIDSIVELTIQSLQKGLAIGNYGVPGPDIATAQALIGQADFELTAGNYKASFYCKCLAYRIAILGLSDLSATCAPIICSFSGSQPVAC